MARKKTLSPGESQVAHGMSDFELQRPGSRLLHMLYAKAAQLGLTRIELAGELGVTYGYLSQLQTGVRDVANVSDEWLAGCARFLGLTKLAVMMIAGKLTAADLYETRVDEPMVQAAWNAMIADAEGGIPGEFDLLSTEGRIVFLRYYERATGRKLLPPQLDRKTLAGLWPE